MRILIVTHRYPPLGVAGVERVAEQTAVALQAAGHDVTVLTRHATAAPPVPELQRTARDGVSVMLVAGGGPSLGRFPWLAPSLERMFERALVETNPDVVLLSHLINHSPTYVAIAHRWRVPVVAELHDFYFTCEQAHLARRSGELCRGPEGGQACVTHCFPSGPRALERWALRTHMFHDALQQADALMCPSQFVADYFREACDPLTPPLHVIANGVELGPRPPGRAVIGDRPLHLAYVGVVAAHKGNHIVLEALRLARLPRLRFSLFGEAHPPYFRTLNRLADGLPNVDFRAYGVFRPAELPFLLEDVDAVVIPSLVWETYSLVAREAFACGVPVIASRIGALPEAVRDGENGLLFEPGSAIELATHLSVIDSDRSRLAQLRAGIRRTDWISVQERIDSVAALLASVVAAGVANRASDGRAELAILRDSFL